MVSASRATTSRTAVPSPPAGGTAQPCVGDAIAGGGGGGHGQWVHPIWRWSRRRWLRRGRPPRAVPESGDRADRVAPQPRSTTTVATARSAAPSRTISGRLRRPWLMRRRAAAHRRRSVGRFDGSVCRSTARWPAMARPLWRSARSVQVANRSRAAPSRRARGHGHTTADPRPLRAPKRRRLVRLRSGCRRAPRGHATGTCRPLRSCRSCRLGGRHRSRRGRPGRRAHPDVRRLDISMHESARGSRAWHVQRGSASAICATHSRRSFMEDLAEASVSATPWTQAATE